MTSKKATPTLYWLSFADARRPKGTQFLGACIVTADGFGEAMTTSWLTGCNPGGEVRGTGLPPEYSAKVPPSYIGRLLDPSECEALDAIIVGLH
jgi:hypothetical protein